MEIKTLNDSLMDQVDPFFRMIKQTQYPHFFKKWEFLELIVLSIIFGCSIQTLLIC